MSARGRRSTVRRGKQSTTAEKTPSKTPTKTTTPSKSPRNKSQSKSKSRSPQKDEELSILAINEIVDLKIRQLEYTPIQRIDLVDKSGESVSYLKVKSPLGFMFLLEIDNSVYLTDDGLNICIEDTNGNSKCPISTALKRGILDNFSRTDVAILRENYMCRFVRKVDTFDPKETHYTCSENLGKGEVVEIYPIVKLSELIADPHEVANLLFETISANRMDLTAQIENSYRSMTDSINLFMQNASKFVTQRKQVINNMSVQLSKLEVEQRKLTLIPEPTIEQKQRIKILSYNLEHLNNLVEMYFDFKSKIDTMSNGISSMNRELVGFREIFDTEFEVLNKEFIPNHSK